MADPTSATTIPHLLGITLDTTGIANTQVAATNLTTGETQRVATDTNKVVILDAAKFTSGYTNGDKVLFENVGASKGAKTITIDTSGDFQEATIVCTVALTVAINL